MATCDFHAKSPGPMQDGGDCAFCLREEYNDVLLQLREKEHYIKVLQEKRHEAFFFLLMFFCKVYQTSCARMRKIQETIVKNNNYNVKVREERVNSSSSVDSPFHSNKDDNNSSSNNNNNNNNNNNIPSSSTSISDSNGNENGGGDGESNLSGTAMDSSWENNTNHMMHQDLTISPPPLDSPPRVESIPSPHFPPPSIIVNTHDSSESSLIKHFHHIIYENALDPILIHDTDGWIVDANGAAVALTGYSIEELRQKHIRELESRYVAPDPKIVEQLMKGAAFRIYGEHISKHGRVFPVEVHISLATVEGKNYVVGLFRDITEILRAKALEKANEVALATNRAKNIFLATMSHELRTPLYGVMASLEILKQSSLTSKQLDILDCAINSAVILKGIVNDMLDLSVLELGMFRFSKEKFSFFQYAGPAFEVFSEAAKIQGLSFKWLHNDMEVVRIPSVNSPSFPPAVPSNAAPGPRQIEYSTLPPVNVVGDPKRLQQVMMNLLSNAVKFTPRGGSVVLRTQITSEDEKSVKMRIEVADTGIGLEAEQLQRVFEKFTQAEEGSTRKYGGTGIGLYITNKLVLLMGGKLSVKSEPRKGAVFTIDIRLLKHSADAAVPSSRNTSSTGMMPVETPPLVAAMAAYHRFGYRKKPKNNNNNNKLFSSNIVTSTTTTTTSTITATTYSNNGSNNSDNNNGTSNGEKALTKKRKAAKLAVDSDHGNSKQPPNIESIQRPVGDESGTSGNNSTNISSGGSATSRRGPGYLEDRPTAHEKHAVGDVLSVLLVEDNLVNQKVGKRLLRTLGVRDIDIANDGEQCLEKMKSRRSDKTKRMYNVILMDKQMPFLDGIEATRAIRKQELEEGFCPIIIIALTADCRAGVDQEVLSAGMNWYLTKPVRAESLYNAFVKHGLLPPPP